MISIPLFAGPKEWGNIHTAPLQLHRCQMCTDEQNQKLLDALKLLLPREPVGQTYLVSDTQGFVLDYKNRRHLYVFTPTALTFNLQDIGNVDIPAKIFTEMSFRANMRIFTVGQPNPVSIWMLATDDVLYDLPSNADGQIVQTLTAQGPATVKSSTQQNPMARGCVICVNITAISGGGTLTVTILEVDPVSAGTNGILTSAALNGTGQTFLHIYPGITASNNVSVSAILPRSWAISSVVAGGGTLVSATLAAALEI